MGGVDASRELASPVARDGGTTARVLPGEEVGGEAPVTAGNLRGLELGDERAQVDQQPRERRGLNRRGEASVDRCFLCAPLPSLSLRDDADSRSKTSRVRGAIVHGPRV